MMFDSCICVEPDQVCELIRRDQRTASKKHRCCECGCEIQPGQRYEVDVTKYEDSFTVYKTCEVCVRIRSSLFNCGWYYGRMWEDIHEAFCGYNEDGELECICP